MIYRTCKKTIIKQKVRCPTVRHHTHMLSDRPYVLQHHPSVTVLAHSPTRLPHCYSACMAHCSGPVGW